MTAEVVAEGTPEVTPGVMANVTAEVAAEFKIVTPSRYNRLDADKTPWHISKHLANFRNDLEYLGIGGRI